VKVLTTLVAAIALVFATPPLATATSSEAVSVFGDWDIHCCGNTHHWTLRVSQQSGGGTFSGDFLDLNTGRPESKVSGRTDGGHINFDRTGPGLMQHWNATLVGEGQQQRMTNGRWDGTGSDAGFPLDFHAERPGAALAASHPAPPPSPSLPSAQPRRSPGANAQVPQLLYDVWNSEACAFTATSLLSIRRSSQLSRIETWYNWRAGETSIPYLLVSFTPDGPLGGQIVARGVLVRGGCDPLQSSWCVATSSVDRRLEPGQYALQAASARICYNSSSGGPQAGFIKAYGSPL
jgi:hypothetical protein